MSLKLYQNLQTKEKLMNRCGYEKGIVLAYQVCQQVIINFSTEV